MSKYNGSIELISGLKQKNNQDFPLVEAHAVAINELTQEGELKRLDEKLIELKEASNVSNEVKQEIIQNAKSEVFEDARFTAVTSEVSLHSDSLGDWNSATKGTIGENIDNINSQLEDFQGDNAELKITFNEKTDGATGLAASTLYLHTGETPIPGADTNIISETIIVGGTGSGATSEYNFKLEAVTPKTFSILKGNSAIIKYKTILTKKDEPEITLSETVSVSLYSKDSSGFLTLLETKTEPAGIGQVQVGTTEDGKPIMEDKNIFDVTQYITKTGINTFQIMATYNENLQDSDGNLVVVPINKSQSWDVTAIEMYFTSTFDDTEAITNERDVIIPYTIFGSLEKTVYEKLNGEVLNTYSTKSNNRGYSMTIPVSKLSHGAHDVEIYCTGLVGTELITSQSLKFCIMYAEAENNTPIIRLIPSSLEGTQYSSIPIKYSIYQRGVITKPLTILENDVILRESNVGEYQETYDYQPLTAGEKKLTFKTNNVEKTLIFQIADFKGEINPVENGLELDFNPRGRTNQDKDFNIFKNNASAPLYSEETLINPEIKEYGWTLSENFDWVNGGWQLDEDRNTYFCIKAGTYVDINYLPFNNAKTLTNGLSSGTGKELKLVFKTTNIADTDAVWLNCLAKSAEGNSDVGLEMKMHNGYVYSTAKTLEIPYSEDDIIELDLNIVPFTFDSGSIVSNTPNIPMIMPYEDGTPAKPAVLTSTNDSFKQETAVPIRIGSDYGDIHIYRMKFYERFLSEDEILNNFIADARTGQEMADRYNRNQILDDNNRLTPEALAEACPDLKIIKLSAPHFTNDKGNKIKNTTIQFIHKGGRPIEDNWTATGCIHNGQGTSSNAYGYAGRNLEFNMKEDTCEIKLADGTVVDGITLDENSYPTNYLNLKVNIASTDHTNNALLQKRYDRYLPYQSAAAARDSRLKNTMNFFNAVLFIQETGDDRREFDDNEWHFYSIGNIGDSKKTDKTRASDPKDDNEFCVEIMDWNRDLSAFPTETRLPAPKGTQNDDLSWKYNGMIKDSNKAYLLFKTEDGKFEPAFTEEEINNPDVKVNIEAPYYIDVLEHDDFSEDFTYGFRYTKGDDDNLDTDPIIAKNKAKWIEIYRFLTQDLPMIEDATTGKQKLDLNSAEVQNWKQKFTEYVNLEAAFYYYLFTLRYTMVDNRAKNSFWHWGKTNEYTIVAEPSVENMADYYEYDTEQELGAYESDYVRYKKTSDVEINPDKTYYTANYKLDFWDYDNDTALGIDNTGKLNMSYGVEDLDLDANATGTASNTYFRAGNSQFFMRLTECFSSELTAFMTTLENQNAAVFSADSLIKEFDDSQNMFPERLWHEQYKRVYKRTYVNGSGDSWDNALYKNIDGKTYLSTMMNGKKKYQRRQFERNQDIYISSKFLGALNFNDENTITLRGGGDMSNSTLAVPQDGTVHITPYLNMYLNLAVENAKDHPQYFHQRCKAGETYSIPYPSDKIEFIYIRGGKSLQSLGDLSKLYLRRATLESGEKLKEIILGNDIKGFENDKLKSGEDFSISGMNKILEKLDLRNLSGLTGDIPITNIPSLREVYAQGTQYTIAELPNRGALKTVYLPETIYTLIANNLYDLNILELEGYNALGKLIINNCPKVGTQKIVEEAANLKIVKITDIDWSLKSTEVLHRLLQCQGIAEDGITTTSQSVLTGKIHVPAIRQAELDSFNAAWNPGHNWDDPDAIPPLQITFDEKITQHEVCFKNEHDGKQVVILFDEGSILTLDDAPEGPNKQWFNAYEVETPIKVDSADGQYSYTFKEWRTEPEANGENAGNLMTAVRVNAPIILYAHFTKAVKKYTVTWHEITTSPTGTVQVEVEWGQDAIYEGDTPTKMVIGSNSYYLFAGWDKPSTNITSNRNIYPIWNTSNPYQLDAKNIENFSAVDFYALKKSGNINTSGNSDEAGLIFNPGDIMYLQTGYMPEYSEETKSMVLINQKTTFDGTKDTVVIPTEDGNPIRLFNEDKSFTLAIDFEMGNLSETNGYKTLVGCYNNDTNGFQLVGDNSVAPIPMVCFKNYDVNTEVGFKTTTSNKLHREICVIRKVKGDQNLYVYKHDRFNFGSEPEEIILPSTTFNPVQNPLVFGALANSSGALSQYGIGSIYYAKLWWDDLGEKECKNICSWTYDKVKCEYVGANRYSHTDNGEELTKTSFVASYLLDEPMPFTNSRGEYSTSYSTSRLRDWLQSKVFKGLSIQWQQTITPVRLKSFKGHSRLGTATQAPSGETETSYNNYLYIPAVAELASATGSYVSGKSWTAEMGSVTSAYPIFSTAESRQREYKELEGPQRYWTRTPGSTTMEVMYIVVKNSGQWSAVAGSGSGPGCIDMVDGPSADGTDSTIYAYPDSKQMNILFGFSI